MRGGLGNRPEAARGWHRERQGLPPLRPSVLSGERLDAAATCRQPRLFRRTSQPTSALPPPLTPAPLPPLPPPVLKSEKKQRPARARIVVTSFEDAR
ncbi:hypothetical protein I79_024195 [Cricetulus griseus]|uniref:Uncharacterized protein n=1 Tax=Cricetulus griseus TaxID=10029 RepID=G3IK03_CRIGR|nr:hypothetical protein I79_024195 [Cricetulus griseus]ERE83320.1 hypothetical protein H671_2g6802 [Cricetulus griseus]